MSGPKDGAPVVVHRDPRSRTVETLIFDGLGLVVVVIGVVTLTSGLALGFAEFAVGLALWVFGVRAWRSGYLSVSPTTIVIRTTARTRVIPVATVAEITAVERWMLTTRVIPTLWLRDGSAVQVGDFSMRAGEYLEANAAGHYNAVDATVVLIRSVL